MGFKTRRTWIVAWMGLAALALAGCDGGGGATDGGDGGECEQSCNLYTDCDTNQDCDQGCCKRSTRCSQDATCLPSGRCIEGRCIEMCLNDTDCQPTYSCVYGDCVPYPQELYQALTGPDVDEGWSTQTPLRVGIGVVPLDFPVGVSPAGFGARIGPHTPYRDTLGGSDSYWDRPIAKAFAFDNGLRRVILIRVTTSWVTDHMVTDVARRMHEATGENYENRLVLSACHTHSWPGNYSYWLPGRRMGVLGHGDFTKEMFDRHTQCIAEAALAAIEDLQPARFSYKTLEPMDPAGEIHRDRRDNDQDPMDDRLISMRIDTPEGQPRAFLFNFALHGTHSDDTTITGDAPGAVELIAEQSLQELTGQPVVAAFLSGASGDVSPSGDGSGLDDWRKIQNVGLKAWPVLKAEFEALAGQGATELELDVASTRAPINRAALGYAPGTFRNEDGEDYLFGAFQCVGGNDTDPATHYEDGALGCIFSCQMLTGGPPVPDFAKVRLTVLRLGELGFATLPGEPLGRYARDVAQGLVDRGLTTAGVLGYSQDHHFYLMHADSWLQGGYEPSMGIWGWAEADYFAALHTALAERFMTEGGGFSELNGMVPAWFDLPDDTVPPTVTAAGSAGTFLLDAPAQVERISRVVLQWTGGHPGVDLPAMTLEHEVAGSWEPYTNAAGVPYADYSHSSMIWYLGDYEADHTWQLSWEERAGFPTGRYRLRVEGHYWDGAGEQPYTATSQAFELVPCSRLRIEGLAVNGSQLQGVLAYPAGPTTDDGSADFTALAPVGYLLHSNRVAAEFPWPPPADAGLLVDVSVQPAAGQPVEVQDVAPGAEVEYPLTYVASRAAGVEQTATTTLPGASFSADLGQDLGGQELDVTVQVIDAHGNTGSRVVHLTAGN
ncbi:MAG TPA: neutral/alkaline non-lysosomal ceramidase N-terminal domain-containing protein [Myxococcota bacterium]|nr:neutral/alkaline non-lysosomal ceramidase N-terminal domain-containing protein [Myxococcota bacterium]HRY92679.1 neutral/alkaline non-lysosomal ceramidase N-terminal domain-containing protein [Myxococcota bacterium]HSA21637.1 neutral/alkaline non-lysosomal ceramidase N-terminal domain-containing protein [Myxococcota bacterium]